MSVVSLVLAFIFPAAGIVTAILAKKEIDASNGTKGGGQFAKTALLLSVIFFVIQVALIAFWSINYFQAMNELTEYSNQIDDLTDELENIDVPETCWDSTWEEYVDC